MPTLQEAIKARILLLDGAMGTLIQTYGLEEADFRGTRFAGLEGQQKGNNDLLSLTRPDVIADIHRRYLEAGADIITTNTFNAQRVSMADYHLEAHCREINLAAARLARQLADDYTAKTPDKPRFVAGSIGPTNKTCSISIDVDDSAARAMDFDTLKAAYAEQIEALIEGGVDALLVETIFDTLGAKAAIMAARECMAVSREVPLMLSVTVADRAGRTLSGQTLEAFWTSVAHAHPFSVGLNCSFGAKELKPYLATLSTMVPCYVSVHPNAGLPNSLGLYDQTPQQMAAEMKDFVDGGMVNIIGGCCGTTDDFIRAFAPLIIDRQGEYVKPRRPRQTATEMALAGLDSLKVTADKRFIPVGERCNVAGSRKFLRLIKEKNYAEALTIARAQIEAGAQVIDINMDDGLLDAEKEMVHFVNLLSADPDICRVPFMIDSSKWDVIEAALKCIQGKCIVNSISLKEGEERFLSHARTIKQFGAAVVVMAFDEKGQADTYERRIEICERAYSLLVDKVGFNPADIIFDPNVLAICTGMTEHNHYAADFIEATRYIRQNLKGAHVSGGVSNLSFSFRGNNYIREAMHAVFLYHATAAGQDFGIVNPAATMAYADVPEPLRSVIEDVLFDRNDQVDTLIKMAEASLANKQSKAEQKTETWRSLPLEGRLAHAIETGNGEHLEEDLNEALQVFPSAISIIEGPLMDAMNVVGDRFGEGKMFLPQVVKTARTMKQAVAFLQPYIEAGKQAGHSAGKIVMATVKGDVHDIGKNIVGTVMACNNFDVHDIGVMCPQETVVQAVLEENPDLVGLSGLITPSLDEMIHTAEALEAAGIRLPILLGGATTSALHTALKIAPVYSGPVVWAKDASQMVLVATALMGKGREAFVAENAEHQKALRDQHQSTEVALKSLDEARQNKLNLF
ncbi:MAG: methionine synthase [Alloprevotella sp.]